jgi:hypothetical protein
MNNQNEMLDYQENLIGVASDFEQRQQSLEYDHELAAGDGGGHFAGEFEEPERDLHMSSNNTGKIKDRITTAISLNTISSFYGKIPAQIPTFSSKRHFREIHIKIGSSFTKRMLIGFAHTSVK